MPNSREQSLDEDVVFLPVSESSPQFIYCEKERRAVERLLSSGPEAFYSSIGTELPGCFLSPEEVCQISSWAQDYRFKPPPEDTQSSTPLEDFSSTYFPPNSDIPTPDLELGWPEKDPWPVKGNVTVHTNPPAEGDPPIREIIRRHLQQASRVGLNPFEHIFIKDSCGFNTYKVKWVTHHIRFSPTGCLCPLMSNSAIREIIELLSFHCPLHGGTEGLLWCERRCVSSAGYRHCDWQINRLCSNRGFAQRCVPWRRHLHHPESEVHPGDFHAQETQTSGESRPAQTAVQAFKSEKKREQKTRSYSKSVKWGICLAHVTVFTPAQPHFTHVRAPLSAFVLPLECLWPTLGDIVCS